MKKPYKPLDLDRIDKACEHFIHYASRYMNNKDDENTFDAMLKELTKREMVEVLFQIATNCDLKTIDKQINKHNPYAKT